MRLCCAYYWYNVFLLRPSDKLAIYALFANVLIYLGLVNSDRLTTPFALWINVFFHMSHLFTA